MLQYKKKDQELEEEYIFRICSMKDVIGTWADVAQIINDELNYEFTESRYRKQFQAFQRMFEANKRQFMDGEQSVQALEDQRAALEKERHKLYATKLELSRQVRQQSRFELFYENIRDTIQALPMPELFELPVDATKKISCLTISDLHYGATFTSLNNSYSPEECEFRFSNLLARVKDYLGRTQTDELKVVNLGDCIQGILRISDLQLNSIPVVEATVQVARLIASFLNELSARCRVDYYHVPASNHTQLRPLGTKASELATEDVEYIIGNYIKDLLVKNPRVTVNLDFSRGYITVPIFHYDVIAMHGHTIKNVENALKDLSMLHRTFFDYVLLGHFHTGKEIPAGETYMHDVEVLVSPSFAGSDPYSDSLMKGNKGSCKLYVFDEDYGHTETHKIYL